MPSTAAMAAMFIDGRRIFDHHHYRCLIFRRGQMCCD